MVTRWLSHHTSCCGRPSTEASTVNQNCTLRMHASACHTSRAMCEPRHCPRFVLHGECAPRLSLGPMVSRLVRATKVSTTGVDACRLLLSCLVHTCTDAANPSYRYYHQQPAYSACDHQADEVYEDHWSPRDPRNPNKARPQTHSRAAPRLVPTAAPGCAAAGCRR